MENKIITCIQCEKEFVFTWKEQARYLEKGFAEPKRCPECRKHRAKLPPGRRTWDEKETRRRNRKWTEPE